MKVAASVNSDASTENDKLKKHRKTAKRKTYNESSSCESLDKPKDDGSLLRRIIRSEMRKFIRVCIQSLLFNTFLYSTSHIFPFHFLDSTSRDKVTVLNR
jgi:hypothetical protein